MARPYSCRAGKHKAGIFLRSLRQKHFLVDDDFAVLFEQVLCFDNIRLQLGPDRTADVAALEYAMRAVVLLKSSKEIEFLVAGGVIPEGTGLTERPDEIPGWDEAGEDE